MNFDTRSQNGDFRGIGVMLISTIWRTLFVSFWMLEVHVSYMVVGQIRVALFIIIIIIITIIMIIFKILFLQRSSKYLQISNKTWLNLGSNCLKFDVLGSFARKTKWQIKTNNGTLIINNFYGSIKFQKLYMWVAFFRLMSKKFNL